MRENLKKIMVEKRICVVVPTYNNSPTLENVLNRILQYTSSVIVVNDGSTDNTKNILNIFENITVISLVKNKGKGAALREGFKEAVQQGYRYAITIDSDGQHFPEDIPAFVKTLEETQDAIIIGSRDMKQGKVPGKSSFGNRFSNFWFNITTGITLDDTQSGFRLYPLSVFKELQFYSTKFEFEVEVPVRAAWAGYRVVNIPIRIHYPDRENRISHFRPFTDFFRISVLNTILVTLALAYHRPRMFYKTIKEKGVRHFLRASILESTQSPQVIAISIGFGVFMGIIPIWGWQMAIAFAIATATGLNRTLVLIASNISVPPMIPVILLASYATGAWVMGKKLKWIPLSDMNFSIVKAEFLQYLLGSIVLAIVAGILSGTTTFLLLKLIRKSRYKRG